LDPALSRSLIVKFNDSHPNSAIKVEQFTGTDGHIIGANRYRRLDRLTAFKRIASQNFFQLAERLLLIAGFESQSNGHLSTGMVLSAPNFSPLSDASPIL
jgi:hypothetical protein